MEFSQFVYSLGRLYESVKIDLTVIDNLLKDNKINEKEYNYIVSLR